MMCRNAVVTAGIPVAVLPIPAVGIVTMSGRQAEMTVIGTTICLVVAIVTAMNARTAVTRETAIHTVIPTALAAARIQAATTAGARTAPAACREAIRITTGTPTATETMLATLTASAIRMTLVRTVRIITATAILTAVMMTINDIMTGVRRIAGLMIGRMTIECSRTAIPATVAGATTGMTAGTMNGLTTGVTVT